MCIIQCICFFQALALPNDYHKGKLSAFQLLCIISLAPQDLPPPKDHIIEYYRALHQGLVGTDQVIIFKIYAADL